MTTFHSGNISLNSLLKIWQRGGAVNQLSGAAEFWKLINKMTTEEFKGRQLNFALITGRGLGAIQGGQYGGSFGSGHKISGAEYTAHAKLSEIVLSYDEELEARLKGGDYSYIDFFMEELDAKKIGAAQVKSIEAMGDGTGIIGILTANYVASTSLGSATFTISATSADNGRSHIGWIQVDDRLKVANTEGVVQGTTNNAGTNVEYWLVTSVDVDNNQFVAKPYSSAHAAITISSATVGATDPASGDVIYRYGTTPVDITDSIADYNLCSEIMAGLESLSANDGRVVHGMTMSGNLAGTRKDINGAILTGQHFVQLLSQANQRLGSERFNEMKYSTAFMYNGAYDLLAEEGAQQRQFVNVVDAESGIAGIGARYRKTTVSFEPDPYVPMHRVHILPNNPECLEYIGTDFKDVLTNGKPELRAIDSSTSRYKKELVRMQKSEGVMLSRQPAALLSMINFDL